PTRTTGTAFSHALERVDEIGSFPLGRLTLSAIPVFSGFVGGTLGQERDDLGDQPPDNRHGRT
ncbi:hypothetical protein AB4212_15685, partial [Streptomyces sp. 2MCAF27]